MSEFTIQLPSISETPSLFRIETNAEWWMQAQLLPREPSLRLIEPFVLELQGHCVGRRLLFRGDLSGVVELQCGACTETFVYRHEEHVELLLEPMPRGEVPPEGGLVLDPEDQSLGRYAGESLDFEPVLVESLLLSWPMYARCTPGCLGLCADCGCNRNRESCECAEARETLPFEPLRSWLPPRKGPGGERG